MSSISSELILKGLKVGSTAAKIASFYLKLIYFLLKEMGEEGEIKAYVYMELKEVLKRFIKHYYLTYRIYTKTEKLLMEYNNYDYAKHVVKLKEILNEMGLLILQNKILNYLSREVNIKGTSVYYIIKKVIQERPKVNN